MAYYLVSMMYFGLTVPEPLKRCGCQYIPSSWLYKLLQTEINNLISTLAVNPAIAETITKAIEEREQQLAEVNYKIQADIAPSDKISFAFHSSWFFVKSSKYF